MQIIGSAFILDNAIVESDFVEKSPSSRRLYRWPAKVFIQLS